MFVEVTDIGCGFLECFTQSRIQAVVCRVYLFAADFKCRIAEIVELPAVEAQCRIAVLLYVSDNIRDDVLDIRGHLCAQEQIIPADFLVFVLTYHEYMLLSDAFSQSFDQFLNSF